MTSNSRLQSAKKDQKEESKQIFDQKQASCNGGGLRTTAKFGADEEFEGDLTNDDF